MIKLPDNPNERKKIFALMGIGCLALLYVLFVFAVQPYLASIQSKKERLSELEDLIWRARRDLDGVDSNMEDNAELVRELLQISEVDRVILRPSLGNYLLVASAEIKEAAQGLSISIDNINEVPAPVPARTAAPDAENTRKTPAAATARFTPYTVNVSLSGGMHALVEFTGRLEHKNPYLAITRLVIMENQEADPETHFISMHVQWPIWADNDHPRRLEAEQIADEERQ